MGPRPTSIPSGIPNLSNRLATIHQCHRQDRQRSDTIKWTVLQTVVQKLINASIAYGLVNTVVHKTTPSVYSWCEGSLPIIINMQKQLSRYNQKYQITAKTHTSPKKCHYFCLAITVTHMNRFGLFLAKMLLIKNAIKRYFIFLPHLTSASTLLGETENLEIPCFHLNVA